jgi:hypothetical protein
MRRSPLPLLIACLAGLAACATFPEVAAVEGPDVERADYPALVPLETLAAPEAPRIDDDLQDDLTSRAARLQARAAGLADRPVITDESRRRMQAGTADAAPRP